MEKKISPIRIKKILYATDLSQTSVHAFSYAVSLANMYSAGITILHVLAQFPGEQFVLNMINTDTWREIKMHHRSNARDELLERKREQNTMQEILQAFSEEAHATEQDLPFVTDNIFIETGAPAELIVESAQKQNCDLIVMGTHGHGAIADVLIGSTAKWVVKKSPIPVLVIRLP